MPLARAGLGIVLLAITAAAPLAEERHVGIKVGPTVTTVGFEPTLGDDSGRRIAAGGGGFLVLPVTPRLGMQLEALVSARGAKLYDPDEDVTGSVLLTYLDIPLLLRLDGPRSDTRSMHLIAGPYAGIRLGARREVSASGGGFTSGVSTDMRDEVEPFEAGLAVGAGMQIGRRFVMDGRYSWGLTPLNRDRSDGVRIRNRGLSIMAGMRF